MQQRNVLGNLEESGDNFATMTGQTAIGYPFIHYCRALGSSVVLETREYEDLPTARPPNNNKAPVSPCIHERVQ
jgi:hypothetical protein